MSKTIAFVGLLVLIGLFLAACSGGSAPTDIPVPEKPGGQDDGNDLEAAAEELPTEAIPEKPTPEASFKATQSPVFEQSYDTNPVSDRDYSEYEIITLLPPDGIPALTNPPMYDATSADQEYNPDEMVIGVEFNGDARAFPVDVLSRHEIVNDTIGGIHVAVTW
jgi:hypothetical protein